jgi:Tetratricopeptide repeat
MMLSGASRCFFCTNDFERAEAFAENALAMNRHFPGIHILIAQCQWATGKKTAAIRTMSRGVLYEAPWDEDNQKENRAYLQEFMDSLNRSDENETGEGV